MIIVIGATGYVGRYLCPYLKDLGYDVLALGRSKNGRQFLEDHGINNQYFDLCADDAFESIKATEDDVLIDLSACLAEHETPVEKFFEVNTIGVYKTLEFARKNGIKKVIVTSSHKLYNDVDKVFISEEDPISFKGDHSPYIISKIAAENFVEYYNKDFGLEGIVLRLTGVHGYGEILGHLNTDGSYTKSTFEIFFEKALKGERIEVWGDQSIKRDHIYIKDLLGAIEASIRAKGVKGIYNAATGVGYSQFEEAMVLAEVFGGEKKSEVVNLREKAGLTRGYIYDVSKIARDMGWHPQYTDLRDVYEDYKKEWLSKEYHNFHFIRESDRPMTL